MLGYQEDDLAAKELSNVTCVYILKVLNFGEVKANNCGRPINSVAVHLHVEFFIT